MKLIINYDKKDKNQNLIVRVYLFRYIRILKINLKEYMIHKVNDYLKEDDNNSFSTKSYINYKNLVKIIQYRFETLRRNITINALSLKISIGTNSPALTAIVFGLLNGTVPHSILLMNKLIPIKKHYIYIAPNFNSISSDISLTCEFHINPIFITYQYVSIKRRLKKDDQFKSTSY